MRKEPSKTKLKNGLNKIAVSEEEKQPENLVEEITNKMILTILKHALE
jgi:hypothetical protein